jgi:Mg/Co/Ni transporter MgtE
MRRDLPKVHAEDDAEATLDAFTNGDASAVGVLDEEDHVVGLVTPAEIQRAVTLLGASGGRSGGR